MHPHPLGLSLAAGMDLAGLTYSQLWLRYVALGGDENLLVLRSEVEQGVACQHEHNVIAQALNEFFIDRDEHRPVAYHENDRYSQ